MNTEGLCTKFYEVMAGINNRRLSTGLSDHDPIITINHILTASMLYLQATLIMKRYMVDTCAKKDSITR